MKAKVYYNALSSLSKFIHKISKSMHRDLHRIADISQK